MESNGDVDDKIDALIASEAEAFMNFGASRFLLEDWEQVAVAATTEEDAVDKIMTDEEEESLLDDFFGDSCTEALFGCLPTLLPEDEPWGSCTSLPGPPTSTQQDIYNSHLDPLPPLQMPPAFKQEQCRRSRPLCTFLNYLGSRLYTVTPEELAALRPSQPKHHEIIVLGESKSCPKSPKKRKRIGSDANNNHSAPRTLKKPKSSKLLENDSASSTACTTTIHGRTSKDAEATTAARPDLPALRAHQLEIPKVQSHMSHNDPVLRYLVQKLRHLHRDVVLNHAELEQLHDELWFEHRDECENDDDNESWNDGSEE